MIVVTGAAGFIGSRMIMHLNQMGHDNIIAVDEFSHLNKNDNLAGTKTLQYIHRDNFIAWAASSANEIDAVFHLGARTDTTEFDTTIFDELNINYSKSIWAICTQYSIPLLYASSAATYGDGQNGYVDDHARIPELKPLNPYGDSKQIVDEWILTQATTPPLWYGFKFFNVYGPNEYHKERMASVVFHAYHQIKSTAGMKLFRSHRPEFEDGHQSRDFIYVEDVVAVLYWYFKTQPSNGIYNLGTGQARPFLDLTRAVFHAMEVEESISFIDTPVDIRETYQYFTQADMGKMKSVGCPVQFRSLEDGVTDYVSNYLMKSDH